MGRNRGEGGDGETQWRAQGLADEPAWEGQAGGGEETSCLNKPISPCSDPVRQGLGLGKCNGLTRTRLLCRQERGAREAERV